MSNRPQAVTRTSHGLVYWCIYAPPGRVESKARFCVTLWPWLWLSLNRDTTAFIESCLIDSLWQSCFIYNLFHHDWVAVVHYDLLLWEAAPNKPSKWLEIIFHSCCRRSYQHDNFRSWGAANDCNLLKMTFAVSALKYSVLGNDLFTQNSFLNILFVDTKYVGIYQVLFQNVFDRGVMTTHV